MEGWRGGGGVGVLCDDKLTCSQPELSHRLTHMQLFRWESNILKNISLKVVLNVKFNNPSSNIFHISLYLIGYIQSCQINCAQQMQLCWSVGLHWMLRGLEEALGEPRYKQLKIPGLTCKCSQQQKALWQFWWNLSGRGIVRKIFDREMLISILSTTLLQILCKIFLNFKDIVKSI